MRSNISCTVTALAGGKPLSTVIWIKYKLKCKEYINLFICVYLKPSWITALVTAKLILSLFSAAFCLHKFSPNNLSSMLNYNCRKS